MNKIAIIGISTLFPGAEMPEQYWQNLLAQKDSRSTATAVIHLLQSLRRQGVEERVLQTAVAESGVEYNIK